MTIEATKPKIGAAIDELIATLEKFDDKARQTILTAVSAQLGLNLSGVVISALPTALSSSNEMLAAAATQSKALASPMGTGIDIRALKEQKNPQSAQQMACLVAYYLQELGGPDEQKTTVAAADLERGFKHAGYKLSKNFEQLMVDCKKAGYFEGARGAFKLTRVGYNLVTHSLPKLKA